MIVRLWASLISILLLAACSTSPKLPPPLPQPEPAVDSKKPPISKSPTPTKKPAVVLKKGGGFYKDDGPGDEIPDGLDDIPDAEPRWEPLHKPATKPYVVFGKEYIPNTTVRPYKGRGIASWYGKKFHGQKTSIGEPYDMFAMTAAHPTLALPSYVRVTSQQSGKSVVVRVTDRGPFHADRIIDLSYTAAYKLGLINGGSGQVEVEAIVPGDSASPPPSAIVRPGPAEREADQQIARRLLEDKPAPLTAQPGDPLPARGLYLQLGAFASLDNAETLKNHLLRELDWVSETMRINPSGGIHRLQLGPYASRQDADRVAERIRSSHGFKPTVVTR